MKFRELVNSQKTIVIKDNFLKNSNLSLLSDSYGNFLWEFPTAISYGNFLWEFQKFSCGDPRSRNFL